MKYVFLWERLFFGQKLRGPLRKSFDFAVSRDSRSLGLTSTQFTQKKTPLMSIAPSVFLGTDSGATTSKTGGIWADGSPVTTK
ncbi:MAG: hypothetical protein EBS01_13575, partial [Verrucomicrobia bacterium]|nr:hypothetical protein [Verrucomicrobiota bacterium]